jgi:uncharacterized membrane protein
MANKLNLLVKIGFIVSLILNGFLFGLIAGGPFLHGPPPPDPSRSFYEATAVLPPETRDKVVAILDKQVPRIRQTMRQGMDRGFTDIRNVLTAPNFSPGKLDEASKHMSEFHSRMGKTMDEMIKEIATALPDAHERSEFFKRALPEKPPFARRGPEHE